MSRPALEVADIFRAWVGRYIDRNGPRIWSARALRAKCCQI
jgi:hypothetical protein